MIRSGATELTYERTIQPLPKIGPWKDMLDEMLTVNSRKPKRERLTRIRIFEELRALGYDGGYDAVRRYAASWSKEEEEATAAAYVPLTFDPGEAYQFDWSHEIVVIDGATTTVKVAHVRLCHSRMLFVRAYPRETQEMVFDAHDKAFAFFGGACARGIYDNMKTAVDTIFVGRDRAYNRRFQQMCGHYLVDPVACTPASGWEKGQVENQVGVVRRRFFVPRPKFKSYAELNAWLKDRCVAWASPTRTPSSGIGQLGRSSSKNAPAWCRMSAPSTASTRCLPRCPKPASSGSTRTATPWMAAPSVDLSRSVPMPSGSSSGRTAKSWGSTLEPSGATRPSMTRCTTSLFWLANRARSGMARPLRTGTCRQR